MSTSATVHPETQFAPLTLTERVLLGPGPSNMPPDVARAMMAPLVGHLDPQLFRLLDETAALLRLVFQTQNRMTLTLPATGMGGMEAMLLNLLEPGDTVIIGVAGFFADRMTNIAGRIGAKVVRVEAEWGQPVPAEAIQAALKANPGTKLVALVHGETSTGLEQPIKEIADLAHAAGALLLVDAVASLGGVNLPVDEWGIDACYTGSQKCLSAPPGMAPITLNDRAMAVIRQRRTPIPSFYFDLTLLERYWGSERLYHHTTPAHFIYAMHEACRLVVEEGLSARFARHKAMSDRLVAGLAELDLSLFTNPAHKLATLTAVLLPPGLDDVAIRRRLLNEYNIEIGGGLGAYKGRMWRIGLMGYSARQANVDLLLAALREILK